MNGVTNRGKLKKKHSIFSMYVEPNLERPRMRSNGFKRLESEDIAFLEAKVEEKEVWDVIKECGNKKAPGSDGFNFGFIKKYWVILKKDLTKAVEYFFESGCISNGCNSSFVSLIPKINDPMGIGDFRQISLIGCY